MSEALFDRNADDDALTVLPRQIVRVLTKRWYLLFGWTIAGGVIGLLLAMQMTRTYTATGDIVIDSKAFAIPELQGAISGQSSPDPLPAVRTAAVELTSPALLESVVDDQNLITSVYFNPDLRKPSILTYMKTQVEAWLPDLFPATPKQSGQETAVAALELAKRLTVFYDNKSLAVNASVVLPDARLAATIVNAILQRYIAMQGERHSQYNIAANADITKHLHEVRLQVDSLEAEARDLRATNQLVSIMPAGSLGQQQLSELGSEQARASADLQQLQAKLTLASQLTKQGNTSELADVLSSPTISRLREQEAMAAGRLAKLDATVMPTSRTRQAVEAEYQQAQRQITAESNRIVRSLGEQVAAARNRVKTATDALDVASSAAASASLIQAKITQVEKEAESRRQVYQALLERASQTAVSPEVARQSPGVYIGSPAVVPVVPSGPHTKIVSVLGMLGGFMIGCVFVLKRDNNTSFSATPEEIALHTHLPLLGVIPTARASQPRLTKATRPRSTAKRDEALALLYGRVRHQAAHRGNELRSILFVGAGNEDTSLLAQHFCSLAGREGERVLLIDTCQASDISKGSNQNRTNYGLKAVLDGQSAWQDTLVPYPDSMTNFLPASTQSLDVIDRKAATRLRSMLREAADDYTLIVITSRWNVQSTHTSHLVQASDLTVLIVDAQKSRPSAVMGAVDHLTSLKNNIGLAVMARAS